MDDAVTGVVNIITTTGLEYSEVDAFVGQTDNGGDNILDLTRLVVFLEIWLDGWCNFLHR